ncbi:hypothetical protein ACLMJK_003753 [Lecanora helva]
MDRQRYILLLSLLLINLTYHPTTALPTTSARSTPSLPPPHIPLPQIHSLLQNDNLSTTTTPMLSMTNRPIPPNLSLLLQLIHPVPNPQSLHTLLTRSLTFASASILAFGRSAVVPDHYPDPLTNIQYGGLEFFFKPTSPVRGDGMTWGEFELLTRELWGVLWEEGERMECEFVLYRVEEGGFRRSLGVGGVRGVDEGGGEGGDGVGDGGGGGDGSDGDVRSEKARS